MQPGDAWYYKWTFDSADKDRYTHGGFFSDEEMAYNIVTFIDDQDGDLDGHDVRHPCMELINPMYGPKIGYFSEEYQKYCHRHDIMAYFWTPTFTITVLVPIGFMSNPDYDEALLTDNSQIVDQYWAPLRDYITIQVQEDDFSWKNFEPLDDDREECSKTTTTKEVGESVTETSSSSENTDVAIEILVGAVIGSICIGLCIGGFFAYFYVENKLKNFHFKDEVKE